MIVMCKFSLLSRPILVATEALLTYQVQVLCQVLSTDYWIRLATFSVGP